MKEATKRATSAALAHMLAVTAMLVIASVLFYGSNHRAGISPGLAQGLEAHVTFSK